MTYCGDIVFFIPHPVFLFLIAFLYYLSFWLASLFTANNTEKKHVSVYAY